MRAIQAYKMKRREPLAHPRGFPLFQRSFAALCTIETNRYHPGSSSVSFSEVTALDKEGMFKQDSDNHDFKETWKHGLESEDNEKEKERNATENFSNLKLITSPISYKYKLNEVAFLMLKLSQAVNKRNLMLRLRETSKPNKYNTIICEDDEAMVKMKALKSFATRQVTSKSFSSVSEEDEVDECKG